MYSKRFLMTIFFSIYLMSAGLSAETFIFDEFEDGDITTNTSGAGDGFEAAFSGTANVVEEEGLIKVLGGDGGSHRSQIGSKDSFSADGSPVYGIFKMTDMYRSASVDGGTARFYVGFSVSQPNLEAVIQGDTNGLWIIPHARYTYVGVDDLQTGQGALIYIDGSTVTRLAEWTWDSSVFTFDTASGLRSDRVAVDMLASDVTFILESSTDGYSLTFTSDDPGAILPEPVEGAWADAGLTNDMSEVYASVWAQGAFAGADMAIVMDLIVVNEEGWTGGAEFPLARSPAPKAGSKLEDTWANLSWRAGDFAVSHNLYFGTSFDDVNDGVEGTFAGNLTTTSQVVGFFGFPAPDGLQPGTTYYWRVDEVNDANAASPWKGDVWSFSLPPRTAYNLDPVDGAMYIDPDVTLSWTAGLNGALHHVYFGDNFNDVNDGAGQTYKGGFPELTYVPGTLEMDKTYYWRIDEFDGAAIHKGNVLSFSTMPVIDVTDPNLIGWWKFDAGIGTIAPDWSGHGNHGMLVEPTWLSQGWIGQSAMEFGSDSYMAIRNLALNDANQTEVSVSAWVRTSESVMQTIVSFDRSDYWRFEVGSQYVSPGLLGWEVSTSDGTVDLASQKRVDDGQWHHVAGVFDNGTMTIYIDGTPDASTVGGNTFGIASTRYGFVGSQSEATAFDGDRSGSPGYWMGSMDDVRIYNRALTQDDIAQVMRGDPLLAWGHQPPSGIYDIEDVPSSLTWNPGDMAAQHDVYLGTDEQAVQSADASDATGTYRGQQAGTIYTPAEPFEWGQDYFWRIDEINTDGTVSRGGVRAIMVADYRLIDDFESYTDDDPAGEAIWQTWTDGYDDPTNGGQVGYLVPPYTEPTIVNVGSSQSMPLLYNNTVGVTNSQVELPLTSPRDWTAHEVGVLSLWFRGYPPSVGSFTEGPVGTFTMTAAGSNIGGTSDEFHFAYKTLTGPGSITARVDSILNTHDQAKAGVMIRDTLDPNSAHAFAVLTPANGVGSMGRTAAGGSSFNTYQADITAPHWVKLDRDVAGNFTVSHSANGSTWQPVELSVPTTILMDGTVYIGLALTGRNPSVTGEAKFSNVTITGNVGGQWVHQDIGILGNNAEPLYVAITDGAGASAIVAHDDAGAATIDVWTEWLIDLQRFTEQGVNLADIDKIAIGLGTGSGLASPGGSGTVFFDDIRLQR